MRQLFLTILLTAFVLPFHAQDSVPVNISLYTRGDYQRSSVDGETFKDNCGFKGKYFLLMVSGNINEHFSYSLRHRLEKANNNASFFDATDWLHLDYSPDEHFTFSGGKQIVDIGSFEYDRCPIDLYATSEIWNGVAPFQWGASASYGFNNGADRIRLQVTQSPFHFYYKDADMYAYNLYWQGHHSLWKSLWSVNFMEWKQGHFINFISLGNEFNFGQNVRLQLDLQNRAASHQTFLFKDWSVIGELSVKPCNKLNLFAKASYDTNKSGTNHNPAIADGTEVTQVSGGVEYFPLQNYDVRLHAYYAYSWGTNTNPKGAIIDKHSLFGIGVAWRINVLPWTKFKKQ